MRDYYKQLFDNKMDNLEEMDTSLEKLNLSRLNQEEIERSIRDYYKQLFGNKMDNLEEMDRFLEKFNFPKLNQEEI